MRVIHIIVLLLFILLVGCGFWQLHRAQAKQELLHTVAINSSKPAQVWQPPVANPQPYKHVALIGHYLPYTFLIDNQYYKHQVGFNVVNPFQLINGKLILLDRGWIERGQQRLLVPKIVIPQGWLSLSGQVYYPDAHRGILLGSEIEAQQFNLTVIEQIDIKLMSNLLHNFVYPFIIRLDKINHSNSEYVRDWQISVISPERHYAYALQWFAMAITLLIIYWVMYINES